MTISKILPYAAWLFPYNRYTFSIVFLREHKNN
jgi:hypothetical protein